MGWLLFTVVGLLLIDLVIRLACVRLIRTGFESRPPFNVPEYPPDPMAETVTTVTADGVTLRGSLHRGVDHHPRGLVVFLPETDGCHWSASWYAESLLHAGFDIISFDFRGQGESDDQTGYEPNHWPTNLEIKDITAILAYVKSRPELRELPLMLMGVSRGATLALYAAGIHPEVRAVCVDGPYTVSLLVEHFVHRWAQLYIPKSLLRIIPMWHFRLTIRLALAISAWQRGIRYVMSEPVLHRLRNRPVLLVSGERDNYVVPGLVRKIARKIGSPLCRIWTVPKAKHNQSREMAREAYDQTIAEFFCNICPAVVVTSSETSAPAVVS